METTTEKKKSRSILLWILIILAPVIAGWLIGLISGTNPLRLDAWNTSWNDEVGYYRVVRIMHYYGVPQGMTGFNEITSGNVPFGPYNWMGFPPSVQRYLGMMWMSQLLYPDAAQYDLFEAVKEYYELFYHAELTVEQFDALVANSIGAQAEALAPAA